jgi:hypothetical protein
MQSHHWIVLFVALAIGYFLRPYFPQPANMLGL